MPATNVVLALIFSGLAQAAPCDKLYSNLQKNSAKLAHEFRVEPREWMKRFQKLLEQEKSFSATQISSSGEFPIYAYRRSVPKPKGRILITGGIHGNEAVSVDTVFQFLQSVPENPALKDYDIITIPMLNPEALAQNRRTHPSYGDLNRAFENTSANIPLIQDIKKSLKPSTDQALLPTLHIDLHGAPITAKQDFFVITGQDSLNIAKAAIAGVEAQSRVGHWVDSFPVMLLRPSDLPAKNGSRKLPYLFEEAGVATSETEGTFRTYMEKEAHTNSIVIEYPFGLSESRARAGQLSILEAALEHWSSSLESTAAGAKP